MEKEPLNEPVYTEELKSKIFRAIDLMKKSNLESLEFDGFVLSKKTPSESTVVITTVNDSGDVYYLIAGNFDGQ